MDYSKLQLFSMMQTKMGYHAERQDVLSQNIANADTPGYRPKDLPALEFEEMVRKHPKLQMRQTAPSHKEGIFYRVPEYEAEQQKKSFEIKPVKNAVSVEEEMMKVSDNAFQYQTTTSLYRKTADLFKVAIGK